MNNQSPWLHALHQISAVKEAKVLCPQCTEHELKRIDVSLATDHALFERLIICPKCRATCSARMHGSDRYFGFEDNLSPAEGKLVEEIREAFKFSQKAQKKLNST